MDRPSQTFETIATLLGVAVIIAACAVILTSRVGAEELGPLTAADEITACVFVTADEGERSTPRLEPAVLFLLDFAAEFYQGAYEVALEYDQLEALRQAEDLYACVQEPWNLAQMAVDLHYFCSSGLEAGVIDVGYTAFGWLHLAQGECQREFNAFFEGDSPSQILERAMNPEKDPEI